MKVFISWSGSKRQGVAIALRHWLPRVINSIEPFVSAEDIYAGTRWQSEIASQLDSTNFGIVCVTREPSRPVAQLLKREHLPRYSTKVD